MHSASSVAFFDVDGTLISEKSVLSFHRYYLNRTFSDDAGRRWHQFSAELTQKVSEGITRDHLNAWYYQTHFPHIDVQTIAELSEEWFAERVGRTGFLLPRMLSAVAEHKRAGRLIVLVSGSFREVVAPVARLTGADHALLAPLEEIAGRYTGRLLGEPMIGVGKARAVTGFLREHAIEPSACYAYGDDHTDIPFLSALGHPVVLSSGTRELLKHATERGWLVLDSEKYLSNPPPDVPAIAATPPAPPLCMNDWPSPFVDANEACFVADMRAWAEAGRSSIGEDFRAWLRRLAEQGVFRQILSTDQAGRTRFHSLRLARVREAVAGVTGAADAVVAVQSLVAYALNSSGGHDELVAELLDGRKLAAFALTEPETGSDVAALTTEAVRSEDGYHISGEKHLITLANLADVLLMFVRTGAPGPLGISAFLIPTTAPGLRIEVLPSFVEHPVCRVSLERVHVPTRARVGAEGSGFRTAMNALINVRPGVGGAAVGMADVALGAAIERALGRVVFGKALTENDAVRAKVADLATELDAARLLVHRAAWLLDRGLEDAPTQAAAASMSKLFATERAQCIVDGALQLYGGRGVLVGTPLERLYRAVRALRLHEGASEIQRVIIARAVLD